MVVAVWLPFRKLKHGPAVASPRTTNLKGTMRNRADNAQTRSPIGKKSKVAQIPVPGAVESAVSKNQKSERDSPSGVVSTSGTASKQKELGSKKSAPNKAKFEINQTVLGHSHKYNQLFDAKVDKAKLRSTF
jgi:hypothetical protein